MTNVYDFPHQEIERIKEEASRRSGGGGDGVDDLEKRVRGLELAAIQTGMDIAYVRGKIEDMPTKDWMHTKLAMYLGGLAAFIGIGLTVLGLVLQP